MDNSWNHRLLTVRNKKNVWISITSPRVHVRIQASLQHIKEWITNGILFTSAQYSVLQDVRDTCWVGGSSLERSAKSS